MSNADREKWDAKYAGRDAVDLAADEWLVEHAAGLPPGQALDLACGLGQNAIWLAQRGWKVDAVDVSPVGLQHAKAAAARANVTTVNWIVADLDEFSPAESTYDLVVVFRFLDRKRLPELIVSTLKDGGRLLYETFLTAEPSGPTTHVCNPAFTLAKGELPEIYGELNAIEYQETELPDRVVGGIVARKPGTTGT